MFLQRAMYSLTLSRAADLPRMGTVRDLLAEQRRHEAEKHPQIKVRGTAVFIIIF
jgi:hypothetical protein